jgi:hypothetical protein
LKNDNKQQAIEISNIKENEQKINHHGRRADAIVEHAAHSESSSKKNDRYNALADEYLRLLSIKVKRKIFNVECDLS